METNKDDLKLAKHLAAPFALPGRSGAPLSFRHLPEGGMVVISADGRKLWFTLEEANAARAELGMKTVKKKPVKVVVEEEEPFPPGVNPPSSIPCGQSRDGKSEMIVLPPDLKHLETIWYEKPILR